MLALIAGKGALPGVLARHLTDARQPYLVCALEGFLPDLPDVISFRVETLGSFLATLGAMGVTQACFAGAIQRPKLDPSAIDAATMPLVPRMMEALHQGDDAALRIVLSFFEEAGIAIVGASDLVPELIPDAGVLTATAPGDLDKRDATRAETAHAALAAADIGQALIVAHGQVLAVEALPGTDWMLRSLTVPGPAAAPTGGLFDDPFGVAADMMGGPVHPSARTRQRDPSLPPGGLLYKGPKTGQDLRIDLPTIGPGTVAGAIEAGLRGIVIVAGGTLVLDRPAVIAAADRAGLFLWVRSCDSS